MRRFAWIGGHADVWALFADGNVFRAVVGGLADPWRRAGLTKIAGVEARGFLLGGAVALELGVGFAAIRKEGGLYPGEKVVARAQADYRGIEHELRLQRAAVGPGDRVLVVDDWAEAGSQALAARSLVERCGGEYAGLAIVVDQLAGDVRPALEPVHGLVRHSLLGSSG